MSLPPHRVDYSPIIERPPIRWPNGARVAFWVAPNVEHYECLPDPDPSGRDPWPRTPHRIAYLERALEYMMGRQGVWAATGSEGVDWYAREAR